MDDRLAKPHNANVAMTVVLYWSVPAPMASASWVYATNSLAITLVPIKPPNVVTSAIGTPIIQATGASTTPRMRSIEVV